MTNETKGFRKKLILFLLPWIVPLLVYLVLDAFVLPINFFNFRIWEAVAVKKFYSLLPGPFYPNLYIKANEEGDLGHGNPGAAKKQAEWWTDELGYRNKPETVKNCQIVLLGDSYITGSGLTQEETPAARLTQLLQKNVYSFAPSDMNDLLASEYFSLNPPRVVVLSLIEYKIDQLPEILDFSQNPHHYSPFLTWVRRQQNLQPLWVKLDHLSKWSGLHYLISKYQKTMGGKRQGFKAGPLYFFDESFNRTQLSGTETEKIVNTLKEYQAVLKKRGIDFIFMPIPNKESIYTELRPDGQKPSLLPDLVSRLKKENLRTIDLQTVFIEESRKRQKFLYQKEDTHWNALGVEIAMDSLKKELKK